MSTLATLVPDRARSDPNDVALRFRADGRWQDQTWAELADRVEAIAAGLLTGPVELQPGDAVGLLASTSPDWIAADFAALSIGALTVPIYTSLVPAEVGYMHVDTGIRVLFVENADQYAKVQQIRDGFEFLDRRHAAAEVLLEHLVVFDPSGLAPSADWESLDDLERRGRASLDRLRADIETRRNGMDPDRTATFTYTSGTTGPPKAVTQTSANHLAMVDSVRRAGLLNQRVRDGGLLLFLPLAHSFGRLVQFAGPALNLPLVISSVPTLARDITESRPGFVPAAPRVFEKIKTAVEQRGRTSRLRRMIFDWAVRAGRRTAEDRLAGRPPTPASRLRYAVADRLVLAKVRTALGLDRTMGMLSGAAPLQPEVNWFFLSLGLELYEAYGLTETCPGLTANRPGAMRVGTVGQPLPGVEIRIGPGSEIIARGPNITRGYHHRPVDTQAVIDSDGWFHTGDHGSIDPDGFLTITGRAKELIKTSGGKYVVPAKIEGALRAHPLIQEAVVVGDGHPYCIALLAVDAEGLAQWATTQSVPVDPDDPEVTAAIEAHVASVNATLASFEQIKRWTVIDPPTVETGLLTASLKVKRQAVVERWSDRVATLYAAAPVGR